MKARAGFALRKDWRAWVVWAADTAVRAEGVVRRGLRGFAKRSGLAVRGHCTGGYGGDWRGGRVAYGCARPCAWERDLSQYCLLGWAMPGRGVGVSELLDSRARTKSITYR